LWTKCVCLSVSCIGPVEYFSPMALQCPRYHRGQQPRGIGQKSPSSKAAALLARGAYSSEYVSTAQGRERRWRLFSTFPYWKFCSRSFHSRSTPVSNPTKLPWQCVARCQDNDTFGEPAILTRQNIHANEYCEKIWGRSGEGCTFQEGARLTTIAKNPIRQLCFQIEAEGVFLP